MFCFTLLLPSWCLFLGSDASALKHILAVLLEQLLPAASESFIPPSCACFLEAGVGKAADFVSLAPSAYGAVTFSATRDDVDKTSRLNIIQIKKLSSLLWLGSIKFLRLQPLCWFDLTDHGLFRAWRAQPTVPVAGPPAPARPSLVSAISEFQKGVKRSVADHKPFKENLCFNSWPHHSQITACSHNVHNVINLIYAPPDADAVALLHEQKKFVFSMLWNKLFSLPMVSSSFGNTH
jgi:hypothetical protein